MTSNPNQDLYNLATAFRECGQFEQAIVILQQNITLVEHNCGLLALLSHCYLLSGKINEASTYLDSTKKLNLNNASINWVEARLLQAKKCS